MRFMIMNTTWLATMKLTSDIKVDPLMLRRNYCWKIEKRNITWFWIRFISRRKKSYILWEFYLRIVTNLLECHSQKDKWQDFIQIWMLVHIIEFKLIELNLHCFFIKGIPVSSHNLDASWNKRSVKLFKWWKSFI